jgi:hypothetical protein
MRTNALLRTAALSALLAAGAAASASAASSQSLTVQCTINVALSVSVSTGLYNFGSVSPSTVVFSTQAVVVTNDSNGRTEDYTISASTFMAAGGGNWTITGSTSAGVDQFGLCAVLNSAAPLDGLFTASDCFGTAGTPQNMDTTHFAGNQNGDHVVSGAAVDLWLRFATPTSITGGAGVQQSETVTITANDAGLFP